MLEIVRGRTWEVVHTVLDYADGPESDLSAYLEAGSSAKCEIREKSAVRLSNGDFRNELVAEPAVTLSGSSLTLAMTRSETRRLRLGIYQIDVVLTDAAGNDWTVLPTEPVSVTDQPTQL